MKFLRNPYVVGILAVAALLLVFRNSVGPLWQKWMAQRKAANAPASSAPAAPAPVAEPNTAASPQPKAKTPALERPVKIDLGEVGWKVNGAPRRDPFQAYDSVNVTNRLYPAAWEVLSLSAIWRQTGSSLAVINHKVVSEGDSIIGATNRALLIGKEHVLTFTIEKIDGDHVWVQGPSGREQLDFRAVPATSTNANATLKNATNVDGTTAMR